MRLMVFFDLPMDTARQRRDYRQFRKFLLKEGYIMQQQSVYSKLVVNDAQAGFEVERLKKHRPQGGVVQLLKITEKQFERMVVIAGNQREYDEIDSNDRLLVI